VPACTCPPLPSVGDIAGVPVARNLSTRLELVRAGIHLILACVYRRDQLIVRRRPISELVLRLRARGWRITAQRRVVAEVLAGEHIHLTADAVYSQARQLLPEISLATVYNT